MSLDRPSQRRNSGFVGFGGSDHVRLDNENHVPTRKSVSTDSSGRMRGSLREQILFEDKEEEQAEVVQELGETSER